MPYFLLLLTILLTTVSLADACCAVRRPATVRAFRRTYPCPSTGKRTGACPGYVVDHQVPLCLGEEAGGRDIVANLAWQAYGASLLKDRQERVQCRQAGHPCAHEG